MAHTHRYKLALSLFLFLIFGAFKCKNMNKICKDIRPKTGNATCHTERKSKNIYEEQKINQFLSHFVAELKTINLSQFDQYAWHNKAFVFFIAIEKAFEPHSFSPVEFQHNKSKNDVDSQFGPISSYYIYLTFIYIYYI